MNKLLLTLSFGVLGAAASWAGTICPGGIPTKPFPHSPDAAATGCNVLITISQTGSVVSATTTVKDASPYDGSEDTLVGVLNNSSITVSSLTLTGTNIFGLDGDGICTFTFTGSSYCSTSQKAGTDPQSYYGPTSTFSITNTSSGTVNFSTPIAAGGGSTYFSLEEPPTASLQVVVGGVPEPGTLALMGGGFSLLLVGLLRRSN